MPSPGRGSLKAGRHRTKADPLAREVGKRIRRLRLAQDFKFDAFVEETGLGRGYISELERGFVVPSLHALAKVAAALELTVADLVVGDSAREELFVAARELPDSEIKAVLEQVRAKIAARTKSR